MYTLKIIKKINLPPLPEINKIICDRIGNFYILSGKESIVLKIDSSGKILDSIIKGKGYGVGEGKFLGDIEYDEENKIIFISDFILNRISQFNEEGKFINSFLVGELFGNIGICADTIFLRILEEVKEVDSLNYEAFLFHKVHKKTGNFLGNVAKSIINREIDEFFSMPFTINCGKRLIYLIIPPDKIEIRKLNGEIVNVVRKSEWVFLSNLFLLNNRYLVISSFSESKEAYIIKEMIDSWKRISLNKMIKERILRKNLFKIQKEPPKIYEEISYVVDIFDTESNKFILKDYLPQGELVGAKDNKVFFVKSDTLLIFKLE
ncbi:MAG: hypothetical protein NC833_07235 [Candidatus Omnitrophica bacterium]|nr:hypothetical protein [Candidatus Omnitrophota bacterium]